jgi:hypothetical protein
MARETEIKCVGDPIQRLFPVGSKTDQWIGITADMDGRAQDNAIEPAGNCKSRLAQVAEHHYVSARFKVSRDMFGNLSAVTFNRGVENENGHVDTASLKTT